MKAKVILLNDHGGHGSTQVGILIDDKTYISIEGENDWTIIQNFERSSDIRKVIQDIEVPDDFEEKIYHRGLLQNTLEKVEKIIEGIYYTKTEGCRHLAK